MTRPNKIGLTVCALVLLALLAWLGSHLERVHGTVEVGPQGEARTNPWLACERLFDELGLPAHHEHNLSELPPTDHALFLCASSMYENEQTSRALLDWTERGGRLVLLLPSDYDQRLLLERVIAKGRHEFPLAKALDVELHTDYVAEDDEETDETTAEKVANEAEKRAKASEDEDAEDEDDVATLDLGQGPLEVAVGSDVWFESSRGEHDYVLLREHGQGRVTFVSSDAWLDNRRFGRHDHARFAWQLANLGGRPAGVWCVPRERQPGLLEWIAHEGWMVLATGLAFIALWLWKGAARFGPTLADPSRDRRDFSEHIEATADYLWRQGQGALLLAAPRSELHQRIALLRPDLAAAEGERLHTELAQLSGLSAAAVREALVSDRVVKPELFQRIVRNLAQLRKSL